MKKIIFKQLKVRNFLSIGTKEISINFTPGINLITGINLDKEDASNGTGKSSLIESIYFALYGKTLRDLKIDQIPNSYTKGACEAILEFDLNQDNITKSYKVIRSLRPTKLLLFEGDTDITKSTVIQTSELLHSIISCSNTVFENSVVMGANNATSFMAQKKVEKRKFLEGILNLTVFGEMLNIARNDYNTAKYQFDVEDTKLRENVSSLNTYKDQADKQKALKKNKQSIISAKIQDVSNDIESLTKDLKVELSEQEIISLKERYDKLQLAKITSLASSKKLAKQEAALEHSKKDLEKQLNKLINLPDICSECDRPYSSVDRESITFKRSNIESQIKNVVSEIISTQQQVTQSEEHYNKIEQGLALLIQKQEQAKNITKHNETVNWKIQQLNNSLVDLQKDLETSNEETDVYASTIQDYTSKVDALQKIVTELSVKLETLQAAKFILSEEGIRSYIVKKILKILNSKLNMYLKKLDANTKCEFNEYFEETLWDQYGNERSYHNFSNGEQRRIDLAILFAFQDIRKLQADVSMNISIYDELLDSSLDRKGAELVLFILSERAEKNRECVYIVSHRKEAQSSRISKTITLQKKNGITTLLE